MSWSQRFEKFHDENRYFLPLTFIAFILMITGAFYLGPVKLEHDVIVNRTLLFDNDTVILAATLRPDWVFSINVLSTKPVNLSLFNLAGEVVAESDTNTLSYHARFLDLYFVKVIGTDFTVIDFNYSKTGEAPYPSPYLFFGSGLALLLGVIVYFLLEPIGFKLRKKLDFIDALFYPTVFFMSSIIFWVFRDSLMWFLPKSVIVNAWLIGLSGAGLIIGSFMYKRKLVDFSKSLIGYLVGYSAIFLSMVLDYAGLSGYIGLLVNSLILLFLIALYYKSGSKTSLLMYSLTWLTSVVIKLFAYSVGIPVFFDTFLSTPSVIGTIPLLVFLSSLVVLAVYLFVRAVYAKSKAEAVNYGLYASICVQAILQIFTGTSLL
ncbi:MAG: hypothetical protein WC307_00035 [Candidatus Nanoarchaeia archaeon]|jgi:hypothetical protein